MVEEYGSTNAPVFQYGDFLVEATNIGAASISGSSTSQATRPRDGRDRSQYRY